MNGRTRRYFLVPMVGLGLGAAVWLGVHTAATYEFWHPKSLQGTVERRAEWVIVIGRRPERTAASDTTTPHRNSPLALYQVADGRLVKRAGDLTARSTSTAERMPEASDWSTVAGYVDSRSPNYPYGYLSVPPGLYNLKKSDWRNGETTAFLLSSINNTEGYIDLTAQQTIRYLQPIEESGVQSYRIVEGEEQTSRGYKSGVYLHPTFTRFWSHLDSQGCINLYSPRRDDENPAPDDYGTLLGWLSQEGLMADGNEPLLLLVPFVELAGSSSEELPAELPLDLLHKYAKGVTLRWQDGSRRMASR